jgi:hypothetical protein
MSWADLPFWMAAILAAVLVGMSKGGMPIVGMLATPVLALFLPPVMAAGLLLPVYIVSDVFGLWAYRHAFNRKVLAILGPATTFGVFLGWLMASTISDRVVTGLVGVIGLSFAANLLFRPSLSSSAVDPKIAPGMFWGTITGFTSFVSHAGGPPYQVYVLPLQLHKTVFAGTTTVLFAYVNAIKLLPYWALGQLSLQNLQIAAVLLLPASLAVFAGVKLVKAMPQDLFYKLVTWALLLVSLKLLYDAAMG